MLIMTCYNQTCKFFECFFYKFFLPICSACSKNKFVCMEW